MRRSSGCPCPATPISGRTRPPFSPDPATSGSTTSGATTSPRSRRPRSARSWPMSRPGGTATVIEVDDPELGVVVQAGTPFSTEPPSRVSRPAPALGEHTEVVLAPRPAPSTVRPGPASGMSRVRSPLEGLRVLDLGNFLAGPLGPDAVGRPGRRRGQGRGGDRRPDASDPAGLRLLPTGQAGRGPRPQVARARVRRWRRWSAWADVVHHNLRLPGRAPAGDRRGTLRAINPEVVYCHASSYGPGGRAGRLARLRPAVPGLGRMGGSRRAARGTTRCGSGSASWTTCAPWARRWPRCWPSLSRDRTGRGQQVTGSLLGCGRTDQQRDLSRQHGGLGGLGRPSTTGRWGLTRPPAVRAWPTGGWPSARARRRGAGTACAVVGASTDPTQLG